MSKELWWLVLVGGVGACAAEGPPAGASAGAPDCRHLASACPEGARCQAEGGAWACVPAGWPDCRRARYACVTSERCVELSGGWGCVAAEGERAGPPPVERDRAAVVLSGEAPPGCPIDACVCDVEMPDAGAPEPGGRCPGCALLDVTPCDRGGETCEASPGRCAEGIPGGLAEDGSCVGCQPAREDAPCRQEWDRGESWRDYHFLRVDGAYDTCYDRLWWCGGAMNGFTGSNQVVTQRDAQGRPLTVVGFLGSRDCGAGGFYNLSHTEWAGGREGVVSTRVSYDSRRTLVPPATIDACVRCAQAITVAEGRPPEDADDVIACNACNRGCLAPGTCGNPTATSETVLSCEYITTVGTYLGSRTVTRDVVDPAGNTIQRVGRDLVSHWCAF